MDLFANNRSWAERMRAQDPDYFARLAQMQAPEYLWIGCSDSRVPANQLLGLPPGAVFVHRNVANIVAHGDLNCLSVMQYAIEVLKVKHIILCGHYGCGGVRAVQQGQRLGMIDNWLEHVHDVQCRHQTALQAMAEPLAWRALCELNVIDQLRSARMTSVVQEAWARGQELTLHGWIYDVADGLLRDLQVAAADGAEFDTKYTQAVITLRKPTGKE
jgi:carbonic anhydrase